MGPSAPTVSPCARGHRGTRGHCPLHPQCPPQHPAGSLDSHSVPLLLWPLSPAPRQVPVHPLCPLVPMATPPCTHCGPPTPPCPVPGYSTAPEATVPCTRGGPPAPRQVPGHPGDLPALALGFGCCSRWGSGWGVTGRGLSAETGVPKACPPPPQCSPGGCGDIARDTVVTSLPCASPGTPKVLVTVSPCHRAPAGTCQCHRAPATLSQASARAPAVPL